MPFLEPILTTVSSKAAVGNLKRSPFFSKNVKMFVLILWELPEREVMWPRYIDVDSECRTTGSSFMVF